MNHLLLASAALLCLASGARAADPKDGLLPFKSDSSGALPPRVKASGTVFRTIAWSDDKGDNLAVFSTTSKSKTKGEMTFLTKSIFVDTFFGKDGKLKKSRTVREVLGNCELDLTNEFLDTSVAVTDLDKNGVGELTFAYRSTCRSDVSPAELKLLVLEGPRKYILRGTTRVHPGGGQSVGGDFTPDFKGAPPAFLEHATKAWAKVVEE